MSNEIPLLDMSVNRDETDGGVYHRYEDDGTAYAAASAEAILGHGVAKAVGPNTTAKSPHVTPGKGERPQCRFFVQQHSSRARRRALSK